MPQSKAKIALTRLWGIEVTNLMLTRLLLLTKTYYYSTLCYAPYQYSPYKNYTASHDGV